MIRKLSLLLAFTIFLSARAAGALEYRSLRLLAHAWPDAPPAKISEIGRGIGVVFSPDLSVDGNCLFYESLGFACFQDADWFHVLDDVHRHNVLYPERRIYTLVMETHGTNGNGLKLQRNYNPVAERSYISIGALQQQLEPDGVYYLVISACNSGRLLRPHIYNVLDPYNGDKLFLPATCGIVNADPDFDASRSAVTIIRPESSHIETTLVGSVRELAPSVRLAIAASAAELHIKAPTQFAISDIMMRMMIRDHELKLVANKPVDELSPEIASQDASERLFRRFKTFLSAVAARETPRTKPLVARDGKRSKSATVR
jgi:hypothetical protein